MKIFKLSIFLLGTSMLSVTLGWGMDKETSESTLAQVHQEKMEKEANAILSYAKNKNYLILGLGVSDNENELKKRFDDQWIFLSTDNKGVLPGRTITINFNDLDALSYFAHKLEGLFDEIRLDSSTYKFIEWNTKHLSYFVKLLKDGGCFIFAPDGELGPISGRVSWDEFIQENKKLIQQQTDEDTLSKGWYRPYPLIIKEGAYEEDINKIISIYDETRAYLPEALTTNRNMRWKEALPFEEKLEELDIKLPYGIYSIAELNEKDVFRKKISAQINTEKLGELMWNDYIPNLNLKPLLLKSGFNKIIITPSGQGKLPIPGHEHLIGDDILVTAVK